MAITTGQTLSHYRLVGKIGEGGMGVVWTAQDTILGRTVAIKVLPANLALDEEHRRMFLDEARLASSVSDAHIAQIYELGREGDLDFIVMEYVDGTPLSKILRGRPLTPEKVTAIGEQVASALARAHRKGLLHRDIKPGNIMVTSDGEVKVVDFGLATLFHGGHSTLATDFSGRPLTERKDGQASGRVMGTVPYMSPEQIRGENLDARSDVFSLGTVLYEMTTGERPFLGATNAEVASEIQKGRIRSPRDLAPKIPMELDRIIEKSLAPRTADRFQTMEDLSVDLRRLGRELDTGSAPSYKELAIAAASSRTATRARWAWFGLLLVVILGAGGWFVWSWRAQATDAHTILVLPMVVRGQTEGADYVGRAFAEAIALNLAQAKQIVVLAVPEASEVGQADAAGRARAATRMGAGRLITGALRRDGGTLQASISLVDSQRNRILWGTQKESSEALLPNLASSLAREVAVQLGVSPPVVYDSPFLPRSPAMAGSPVLTKALVAINLRESKEALESTQRLLEAFPQEPEAHVLRMFAVAYSAVGLPPSSPEQQAWKKTIADLSRVDPESPWVDVMRATMLPDLRESAAQYTKVLSRADMTPAARAFILSERMQDYSILHDTAASIADCEEALRLDPANFFPLSSCSVVLQNLGRIKEAVERAREAVALNPSNSRNNSILGHALMLQGEWAEAAQFLERPCEATQSQEHCGLYAVALQRSGRGREAEEVGNLALSFPESQDGTLYLACYMFLVGNRPRAFSLLRRSVVEFSAPDPKDVADNAELKALLGQTEFASITGDSEFKSILADVTQHYQLE